MLSLNLMCKEIGITQKSDLTFTATLIIIKTRSKDSYIRYIAESILICMYQGMLDMKAHSLLMKKPAYQICKLVFAIAKIPNVQMTEVISHIRTQLEITCK